MFTGYNLLGDVSFSEAYIMLTFSRIRKFCQIAPDILEQSRALRTELVVLEVCESTSHSIYPSWKKAVKTRGNEQLPVYRAEKLFSPSFFFSSYLETRQTISRVLMTIRVRSGRHTARGNRIHGRRWETRNKRRWIKPWLA